MPPSLSGAGVCRLYLGGTYRLERRPMLTPFEMLALLPLIG
jgi:hypothetical protein